MIVLLIAILVSLFIVCDSILNVECRLAAELALLSQPRAVLAHGFDLFAVVVWDGVADRVSSRVSAVSGNVLEKLRVHLWWRTMKNSDISVSKSSMVAIT